MAQLTRLMAAVSLAVTCVTGCGTASSSDRVPIPTSARSDAGPAPTAESGEQSVTLHVNEMCDRLALFCPD